VTKAFKEAIAANDPGGLGPVDAIPLRPSAPAPKLTRALRQAAGLSGAAVALCLLAAALLLATLRRGALWLGGATFAAGLVLRIAHLDQPFLWDQDVQRMQIAASDLGEILAGAGLHDRRPPLLFVVLHLGGLLGQAEWVARLPAALAGALAAPAILWATGRAAGRISAFSAVGALLLALSPVLVLRSREVSELTLFGVLLVVLAGETIRLASKQHEEVRRAELLALAALYAIALWCYYLAIAAILASVAVLALTQRLGRRRWLAIGAGIAAGLPSLVPGARAFWGDLAAREAARANPGVAWGDRGVAEILGAQLDLLSEAAGGAVLLLVALGFAWALFRRQHLVVLAFAMAAGVVLSIAALGPFVRVQPYYAVTVMPLLLLALSALRLDEGRSQSLARRALSAAAVTAAALAAVWFLAGAGPRLANLYVPEDGAFMPGFAAEIRRAEHRRVVTVTHYDGTLLSYYLARAEGVTLRSDRLRWQDGELHVEGLDETTATLIYTHAPDQDPAAVALARLGREASQGPVLVISRNEVRLGELDRLLARCELRREAAPARLLLCRPGDLQPVSPQPR